MKKSDFISKFWPWVVLAFIVAVVAFIRIRLIQIPLERDEGEYAYMGQLLLRGIAPYTVACNMKLPGIYALYAMIMGTLGESATAIHVGLLVANTISIFLLFFLTRDMFGDITATVASASYALLSVSPSVLGTSGHATQFIVPFMLGGMLLLRPAFDSGKNKFFFASGFCLGICLIIKQHAIFFIFFALIYSLSQSKLLLSNWKKPVISNLALCIGAVLPFLLVCMLIYSFGSFSNFWFWTFTYAYQYATGDSSYDIIQHLVSGVQILVRPWIYLLVVAGFGLFSISWNSTARNQMIFLLGFTFFSFLTVCPGFHFRKHYFVTMLPAISLLAGVGTANAFDWLEGRKKQLKALPILIIALSLIVPFTLGKMMITNIIG